MKNISILALFLLLSTLSLGQSLSAADEEAAKQLVIGSFEDIWSDLDAEKIPLYHTDDFIILEQGVVWNNDSIRNYQSRELEAGRNLKRHNKFDFVKVEEKGNAIWLAYHNYATWTKEGKVVGNARWLESAVAVKTEAGWKLQMMHSTRVRKE